MLASPWKAEEERFSEDMCLVTRLYTPPLNSSIILLSFYFLPTPLFPPTVEKPAFPTSYSKWTTCLLARLSDGQAEGTQGWLAEEE